MDKTFWIFDLDRENKPNGNAIGAFDTAEEAIAHATEYTASWADWCVGEVTVVHTYIYEE